MVKTKKHLETSLSLCDTYALKLNSGGHLVVQGCNIPKNIFHEERRKSEKYADLVRILELKNFKYQKWCFHTGKMGRCEM